MSVTAIISGLVAGLYIVTGAIYFGTDDAMTKCQEKHSYDVCFQAINR